MFNNSKRVADSFPVFTLCNSQFAFVNQFKYLGHMIYNSFFNDSDTNREVNAHKKWFRGGTSVYHTTRYEELTKNWSYPDTQMMNGRLVSDRCQSGGGARRHRYRSIGQQQLLLLWRPKLTN